MDHRALLIAATVGLATVATHPAAAGASGLEPDPVYRYKNLAPLGATSGKVETRAEERVRTRERSKRIVPTETRVRTTARYTPAQSAGITYAHYVPRRRYGSRRHYGPLRHRYGYYPRHRWYGYHPRKRVFRGPCIKRVVRYTPRGKIIRIVNRCYRRY